MLLDSQNLFSDAQLIDTTQDSDNIVKFGKGDISYLPLLIQVVDDFTNLTSLKASVLTSSDEDFTTPTTLFESSMNLSQLVAGATFPISYMPKGNLGYIKLQYTLTGNTETTGKITAGIVAACDIV